MNFEGNIGLFRQVLVGLTCTTITFMSGYVTGYSSPVIPQLTDTLLTVDQVAWFGSLTSIAGIPGAFLCSFTIDRIGRKLCVMLSLMPFALGWLLIILANHYSLLYAGRFFTGVGIGMAMPAASVYMGETISKNYRGMLAPLVSVMFMVGLMCVNAVGLVLQWRWLALVGELLTLVAMILLLNLPESPRYLMTCGHHHQALQILLDLGDTTFDCEEQMELEKEEPSVKKSSNIRKHYKSFVLITGLMFFKEASGIMAMLFYAEDIFIIAGYNGDPGIPALVMAITRFLSCIGTSLLAERVGRRPLIIIPGVAMALGCLFVGLHFYMVEHSDWTSNWLPVLAFIIYLAFYSLGWGSLPWVFLGEIFDPDVKPLGIMVAAVVRYTVMFLITSSFNSLLDAITPYGTFWLYSAISIAGTVYAWLCVPETKGIAIEEAQVLLQ